MSRADGRQDETGMSDDKGTGEPRWVPIDAVITLNAAEVAKTGEPHELQDRIALQRALAHPWNVWVYFMDGVFATPYFLRFSAL